MPTKIITIGVVPVETTGADVVNNGPHSPATLDQNIANLRAAVDRALVALGGFSASQTPGAGDIIVVGAGGSTVLPGSISTGDVSVKWKKLTGTTAAAQGGSTIVNHGLNAATIVSASIVIFYAATSGVTAGEIAAGYKAAVNFDNVKFTVTLDATSSGSILSKPFTIMVQYT